MKLQTGDIVTLKSGEVKTVTDSGRYAARAVVNALPMLVKSVERNGVTLYPVTRGDGRTVLVSVPE